MLTLITLSIHSIKQVNEHLKGAKGVPIGPLEN